MGKLVGFSAAIVTGIAFGSNFVPTKRHDYGDGIFFQLIMCIGIWIFGLLFGVIIEPETSQFHPLALLGGFIWCFGNIFSIVIIRLIGLGLGLTIWSGTSICVGWLTGKFGWLGVPKDTSIASPWMNYLGVILTLFSLVIFFHVKPITHEERKKREHKAEHRRKLLKSKYIKPERTYIKTDTERSISISNKQGVINTTGAIFLPHMVNEHEQAVNSTNKQTLKAKTMSRAMTTWSELKPRHQQFFGVFLAMVTGTCMALCFCPIQYLITSHDESKYRHDWGQNLEDYAFTHYCGILLASVLSFVSYCLFVGNRPHVNREGILAALLSGFIWAIAQTSFFIATDKRNLGTDTSFPLCGALPQIVANLWGVLHFKEIQGKDRYILVTGILVALIGVGFIAWSKI